MGFSKRIADYFEVKLLELRPGSVIPFSIYLVFHKSSHIVQFRNAGELITDGFLDRYQEKGIQNIWISISDRAAFESYLNPSAAAPQAEPASQTQTQAPGATLARAPAAASNVTPAAPKIKTQTAPQKPKTPLETPAAKAFVEGDKKAAQKEAQKVAAQLIAAQAAESQKKAQHEARKVVQELLDSVLDESESLVAEIWKMANLNPDLTHGLNVSTYAVVFSLAFGKLDSDLLGDLALAGLLHDVGLAVVSPADATTAWKEQTGASAERYQEHVSQSIHLIEKWEPETSERVKVMIRQHHEKFDGSGYPNQLKGFQFDEISQLLAMSELLDSVSTGQWDGTKRSLSETLAVLEKVEKTRTFPEYFNPEIFEAVLGWTRNPEFRAASSEALEIVGDKARHIVETKAA